VSGAARRHNPAGYEQQLATSEHETVIPSWSSSAA